MIHAIRTFQPHSGWITTGLLTVFVVAFGIFAGTHARTEPNVTFAASESLMIEVSQTRAAKRRDGFFRYH
jgi:hypothetical protein